MAWQRTDTDSALTLGLSGSNYIADTAAHAANYCRFQALTACVIAGIVGEGMDTFAGAALAAGQEIKGRITSITLTSGTGVAYKS